MSVHYDNGKLRIQHIRRQCIRQINKHVQPYLYPSGYQTGPLSAGRPLRIVSLVKSLKVSDYYFGAWSDGECATVDGFTEGGGLMTDAYAGALVTASLDSLPLEDLIKLSSRVQRLEPHHFRDGHGKPYKERPKKHAVPSH